jgi:cytochrome d ubiquinol oxidase subunit II
VLEHLPLIFILAGLAAYAVLAGADFGAGIWMLLPGDRDGGLREHARHAMGPVWEANHVWLIFVLVISWTAYPRALASVASTMMIPLILALIGIVLRGMAYALRAQLDDGSVSNQVERALGAGSVLTPFALGTVAGGIASRRVPVGNAAGSLVTSWLNPTSIAVGVLSVSMAGYLAAVYLAADASRIGSSSLAASFRTRAQKTALLTGVIALLALIVIHGDAHQLWHGLTHGGGLIPLIASVLAGFATMTLVTNERYGLARASAALAVAAVVCGWGVAQRPDLLPGLSVQAAAAGHATLVAVVIAVGGGAVILLPSLALLFSLVLRGTFDPRDLVAATLQASKPLPVAPARILAALIVLGVGAILTVLCDSWEQAIGVISLGLFILLAFAPMAIPPEAEG